MTTINTSALTSQAVWNRFVAGADTDGDGSLSEKELAALVPEQKSAKVMAENDANGDGLLSRDELPKGAFSPSMFEQFLSGQEYRDASPAERRADDAAAIAAMFARADVDGDGVLSADEWDAERTLNMSRWVDGEELPGIVFLARRPDTSGLTTVGEATGETAEPAGLRPEDFMVGRRMELEPVAAEDLPEDFEVRLAELRRVTEALPEEEQPQMEVLDEETVRADMIAKIENMPMTAAFMTRLILSLSEGAETGTSA